MAEAIISRRGKSSNGGGTSGNLITEMYTSNNSYKVPNHIGNLYIRIFGGGGSVGGTTTPTNGIQITGGGGGGWMNNGEFNISNGSVVPITIGIGGKFNTTTGSGNSGGTTSFGTYISANGGGCGSTSGGGNGGSGGGGGICVDDSRYGYGYTYPGGKGYQFGGGGGAPFTHFEKYGSSNRTEVQGAIGGDGGIWGGGGGGTYGGRGGTYGGNGGSYVLAQNTAAPGDNYWLKFTSTAQGTNGTDTSDTNEEFKGIGNVGICWLWYTGYQNRPYNYGGGGGYGGHGGGGGNTTVSFGLGGGGGGGYGAKGGNGSSMSGGGGGGYGGNGSDSDYDSPGGGGGYGLTGYGSGGGGYNAIRGNDGMDGICIIQYYSTQFKYAFNTLEIGTNINDRYIMLKKFLKKDVENIDTGEILDSSKLKAMLDEEKLNSFNSLMGYYKIVTSELNMPDTEVIDKYHGLSQIEDQFRIMKGNLDTRPIFVRTKEHINAHLIICFISLLILRIIQYKIKKSGWFYVR